ncbi:hypothetical protein EUGRSUZ_L00798 [Eucalyptus grandis]|uniref:ATPase AAA-type core domain-containing protein n=1 Tax=Eucalyptus grandis TaxID=71139 RepID=A0A058ZUP8_EUCGR|nr:hypothetical protein EUGRSUZ_L00798 [Eucalyptus grandis]
MAGSMFAWAMFEQYFPPHLRSHVEAYAHKAVDCVYPYIHIKFPEFDGERLERCEAYAAIQNYLSVSATTGARRLKAESVKDIQLLVLSMDENGRFYSLTYRSHRDLITGSYIKHVLAKGKAYYKATKWSHVTFKHPSTLDTLAMEPSKKREIMNDLLKFKRGKEYYEWIGKAWKLGYLLYAHLELTTVKDNTELRKLQIQRSAKSITVIEDIDCSLDLTGQRKMKKQEKDDDEEIADLVKKMAIGRDESKDRKAGLLNFIDGLWLACGDDRIIVFATNFVEKLDPALIRRGRMDKHIEMSYCRFKWFKVLVRNYLGVKLHLQFAMVRQLLDETKMTPVDMVENLMPKSDDENEEAC